MYTCIIHSFCPFLCRKQLYGMKEIGYIIIAHVCVSHSNRSILHFAQQEDKTEAKEKNQAIMHINGHITASCIKSGASGPLSSYEAKCDIGVSYYATHNINSRTF